MVDYLESLERLAMPDELHIKECRKLGIDLTEDYEVVEQAILELISIKKANPSEALEILEEISKEEVLFKDRNTIYMGGEKSNSFTHKDTIGNCFKGIENIKQALLKIQEPKHYLKWEDLKFTYDEQKIKVKLNGEKYTVVYFISPAYYGGSKYEYVGILKDDNIVVYSINGYLYTASLLKQFFNNLHLEVIDNE